MRIPPERLDEHLGKSLAPVYLIAGDEPLQHGEAADVVREQARQRGFASREVMEQRYDGRAETMMTTTPVTVEVAAARRRAI